MIPVFETKQDPVEHLGMKASKQFLIGEGKGCRDKGEVAKKPYCSLGAGSWFTQGIYIILALYRNKTPNKWKMLAFFCPETTTV